MIEEVLERTIQTKRMKVERLDADLRDKQAALDYQAKMAQTITELEEAAQEAVKVSQAKLKDLHNEETRLREETRRLKDLSDSHTRSTPFELLLKCAVGKAAVPRTEWVVPKGTCFQGCDHPIDAFLRCAHGMLGNL